MLKDTFGRTVKDLRISITERCNYKCIYCMPANFLSQGAREEILNFEEITRLARLFLQLGVRKIRITGGEPLVRKDIERLVAMLVPLEGLEDLAITTNGFFLPDKSAALLAAGLKRLNVSLDSLRPDRFYTLTQHNSHARVIAGLEAATRAGFKGTKVNAVLIRGINEDEILDFVDWGIRHQYRIRFIEFMPLDGDARWRRDRVVPGQEIYDTIHAYKKLEPLPGQDPSDPARIYRYADGSGEVGIIASVTQAFCGACSRVRLTADGKVRTCLFSLQDHDLKSLLRTGAGDADLMVRIEQIVLKKEAGHHINDPDFVPPNRPMVAIGG